MERERENKDFADMKGGRKLKDITGMERERENKDFADMKGGRKLKAITGAGVLASHTRETGRLSACMLASPIVFYSTAQVRVPSVHSPPRARTMHSRIHIRFPYIYGHYNH